MTRVCALLSIVFLMSAACGRRTDFLYQSIKPGPKFQTFPQRVKETVGGGAVDLLWVIDNSGSMGDDQENVARNTKIFLEQFTKKSRLDWKMGLISTDASEQPYIGLSPSSPLTWRTRNSVAEFQSAVRRLGTAGSSYEQSWIPIMTALKKYPRFARKGTALAIIMVTDENEQSDNTTWLQAKGMSVRPVQPRQFVSYLKDLKGNLSLVKTYGVFAARDLGCNGSGAMQWNYRGSTYEQFIKATKGRTYVLCRKDFGNLLSEIGKDIVSQIVTPRIQLKQRPVPSSLKLTYQGRLLPGGVPARGGVWTYDFEQNAILLHSLDFVKEEEEDAEVVVSFQEDHGVDYSQP